MILRVLLASFLVMLGANAYAAMDRVHDASGENSARCAPAQVAEGVEPGEVKPDASVPSTSRSDAANASGSTTPPLTRPTLRWHSFLPGMMK